MVSSWNGEKAGWNQSCSGAKKAGKSEGVREVRKVYKSDYNRLWNLNWVRKEEVYQGTEKDNCTNNLEVMCQID